MNILTVLKSKNRLLNEERSKLLSAKAELENELRVSDFDLGLIEKKLRGVVESSGSRDMRARKLLELENLKKQCHLARNRSSEALTAVAFQLQSLGAKEGKPAYLRAAGLISNPNKKLANLKAEAEAERLEAVESLSRFNFTEAERCKEDPVNVSQNDRLDRLSELLKDIEEASEVGNVERVQRLQEEIYSGKYGATTKESDREIDDLINSAPRV